MTTEKTASSFELISTLVRAATPFAQRLLEFRMLNSPLNAQAIVRVTRPEDWSGQKAPAGQPEAKRAWKVWANGTVHLDRKKQIALLADTTIYDWKTLDFRAGTKWKGIPALRELRLDGALNDSIVDSRLSLKMGAAGSQVKALDFADCAVQADLDKRQGVSSADRKLCVYNCRSAL